MEDVMTFPKTIEEFINNHSFKDSEEVYTNGTELIPVFRVEQALEHYVQEIRTKAIEEFAERLITNAESFQAVVNGFRADLMTHDYFMEFVDEIAESMKGEKE